MASRQYTSIIRLFDHCGIPFNSDFILARAKKQLQAEFGIARDGFIEVAGQTYTRHDVMQEIEHPDFMNRLIFHKQLWESPQILEWLEMGIVDLATIGDELSLFCNNKDFDEFFSPYFAGPFNYLSRTILADADLFNMGNLLSYEEFLLPTEREEAFRPIRLFFEENLRILRNTNKENYKLMRPKIIHWIDTDWHIFYNNLPHEFYEVKNELITWLINIGVAVQKNHRRDCRQVSEQLIALQDTPESLRGLIISNHAVYSKTSTAPVGWRGGFAIGWIILMLLKGAFSDGCGKSDNRHFEKIRQIAPAEVKYIFDSLRFIKDSNYLNKTIHFKK